MRRASFMSSALRQNDTAMKSTPMLGDDGDQFPVALGQRAQRQAAALLVQALAVGQHAVVEHGGDDALALDRHHPQLHQAVVEQQHVAGLHVAGQAEVADADLRGSPGGASALATRSKRSPAFSCTLPSAKRSMRIFGPGRSARMPTSRRRAARRSRTAAARWPAPDGSPCEKFRRTTSTPARNRSLEHAGRIGGRAEGGEDLGAAALIVS